MHFAAELITALRNAEHVAIFTGAGVSAESGIPTFRDALTGLWEVFDAEELASPAAFQRHKDVVWGWYEYRRAAVLRSQPNPAHHAIARMTAHVPRLTVITQNVDDLHERAGSVDVLHLHGSLHHPRCQACGRQHALSDELPDMPDAGRPLLPPRCTHCNGWIRPGVIWFGEMLPRDIWLRALQAARQCDVFLSVGTSALVYPAAELPLEAAKQKACVVQINPHATSLDAIAHFNLVGKAGEVLPRLYVAAWTIQNKRVLA